MTGLVCFRRSIACYCVCLGLDGQLVCGYNCFGMVGLIVSWLCDVVVVLL